MEIRKLIKECVTEVLKETLSVTDHRRIRNEIYSQLQQNGFRQLGTTPNEYVEFYMDGFATVACGVMHGTDYVKVERFYDNERFDTKMLNKDIPLPEQYDPAFIKKIVDLCLLLKKGIQGSEPIFGGIDEVNYTTDSKGNRVMAVGAPGSRARYETEHPLDGDDSPLYVEYVSERSGEEPFELQGHKYQYVNAKYPEGKIDIGVYAFAGDIVYSYNAFRKMHNIREAFDPTSVGPNPEASEGVYNGNPYEAWNNKMRQMEGTGTLELTAAGEDDWNRPIYRGADGQVYIDVNLGRGEPSIHSVTDSGEPLSPVTNFKIVGNTKNKHPNALCPRCKNSKPELMKKTPDGKMSCTYCKWEDNPGEPYKGAMEENEHGRYAQDAGAVYTDEFDEFREAIGEQKLKEFLSKFGLEEWDTAASDPELKTRRLNARPPGYNNPLDPVQKIDPEQRKRELNARPPGYANKVLKMRSDQMAKDYVDQLRKQHGRG